MKNIDKWVDIELGTLFETLDTVDFYILSRFEQELTSFTCVTLEIHSHGSKLIFHLQFRLSPDFLTPFTFSRHDRTTDDDDISLELTQQQATLSSFNPSTLIPTFSHVSCRCASLLLAECGKYHFHTSLYGEKRAIFYKSKVAEIRNCSIFLPLRQIVIICYSQNWKMKNGKNPPDIKLTFCKL